VNHECRSSGLIEHGLSHHLSYEFHRSPRGLASFVFTVATVSEGDSRVRLGGV